MTYPGLLRSAHVMRRWTDDLVQSRRSATNEAEPADWFARAAIARCADLVEAECALHDQGMFSVAQILSRTVIEFWLYGNAFVLGGQIEVDRFLNEHARSEGSLEHGRKQLWEQLEVMRQDSLDLRTGYEQPDHAQRQQMNQLAQRVYELRESAGFGGGIAVARYEIDYRWKSAHFVHPSFAMLSQYLRGDTEGQLAVVPNASADEEVQLDPDSELRSDLMLLSDLLGVYLRSAGDDAGFVDLGDELRSAFE